MTSCSSTSTCPTHTMVLRDPHAHCLVGARAPRLRCSSVGEVARAPVRTVGISWRQCAPRARHDTPVRWYMESASSPPWKAMRPRHRPSSPSPSAAAPRHRQPSCLLVPRVLASEARADRAADIMIARRSS
ncbi:hypothetical protein BAE44_0023990 [Dichanthelium oligosanthes]|uniref:Uncharacterized protein n=1 Tax=Dichanthelium oligosanthes TaxID=888268 RepID=A0A1E5UQ50_9POAL|nr:hypothetical protein BAE44_0023990 [Dichanthelium oligosanthes]